MALDNKWFLAGKVLQEGLGTIQIVFPILRTTLQLTKGLLLLNQGILSTDRDTEEIQQMAVASATQNLIKMRTHLTEQVGPAITLLQQRLDEAVAVIDQCLSDQE